MNPERPTAFGSPRPIGVDRTLGGRRLAGDRMAGDRMAGDRSAGDRSAGDRNAGDRSAGDRSGQRPAGGFAGIGGPANGDGSLPINRDDDVVRVRQAVRTAAVAAKLSLVDQTKLVTAASELARNTLIYGGGGEATVEPVTNGRRQGVRVRFVDEGPGIADLDLALTDGYTSGGGLGLGLSGARRLVDEFDIDSALGEGTRITVTKWAR